MLSRVRVREDDNCSDTKIRDNSREHFSKIISFPNPLKSKHFSGRNAKHRGGSRRDDGGGPVGRGIYETRPCLPSNQAQSLTPG